MQPGPTAAQRHQADLGLCFDCVFVIWQSRLRPNRLRCPRGLGQGSNCGLHPGFASRWRRGSFHRLGPLDPRRCKGTGEVGRGRYQTRRHWHAFCHCWEPHKFAPDAHLCADIGSSSPGREARSPPNASSRLPLSLQSAVLALTDGACGLARASRSITSSSSSAGGSYL